MVVSSDNMLSLPFGTSSELPFSDIPVIGCIFLASGAVTEGPAETNSTDGENCDDNQDHVHDEPVISPVCPGDNGVPIERTKLLRRIKIISHREYFTFLKVRFDASGVVIDARTRGALLLLETVLDSVGLTIEALADLGASWRLGW